MKHITSAHPKCIPAEGRSLFDMDFTLELGGDVAPDSPKLPAGDDILNDRELLAGDQFADVVARNAPGNGSPEHVSQVPIATDHIARGQMGQ